MFKSYKNKSECPLIVEKSDLKTDAEQYFMAPRSKIEKLQTIVNKRHRSFPNYRTYTNQNITDRTKWAALSYHKYYLDKLFVNWFEYHFELSFKLERSKGLQCGLSLTQVIASSRKSYDTKQR